MIDMLGFNDLFNLKDKKYAELSMEEKVKISAIFRITKELKPKIEYKYDSW
ncbi:MAG: hypothetical protein LBQ59_01280 [Candidatus Peribacteria bacterium]|jgi:inosine/xanthosine triphosphate pyrophosphatase family protein|nr:hypothetical protein [Candidatus Peribacteria bacterium]